MGKSKVGYKISFNRDGDPRKGRQRTQHTFRTMAAARKGKGFLSKGMGSGWDHQIVKVKRK